MSGSKPDLPPSIRSHLKSLPAYTPIEPFEVLSARLGRAPESIIKLDANENPYGPSPRVRQALAKLTFPHIYPDPESRALRDALADFTGVPVDNLLAGSGADELIDLTLRVVLEPGEGVLSCPPTFGMYAFDTRVNAGNLIEVRRKPDFTLDLANIRKAVEDHRPKVLFLASPNNPDGSLIPAETIDELLKLPVLVVLDEAYIEFCGMGRFGGLATRITQVHQQDNLIVLRTFSKWAGLAGLRVGYGAFPGWLMPILWKAKQPYNVNVAASAAAIAALADSNYLAGVVATLREERQRLHEALSSLPYLLPYPSQANFILCRVSGQDASGLKAFLAREWGILVRYFNVPGLQDHIRISVGRPQETEALLLALRSFPGPARTVDMGAQRPGLNPGPPIPMNGDPWIPDSRLPGRTDRTPSRQVAVHRATGETQVTVVLNLDGEGKHQIETGIGFLDHMLTHLAVHGLFDLTVQAHGDLQVDPHHTVEDVALTLGQAFAQALGDRKGILRMASAYVPMDEALAFVAVDFSGRPYSVVNAKWHGPAIGSLPVTLVAHFLESFASAARCNLHVQVLYGRDDHHQAEAIFKALARGLDQATQIDPRRSGAIPSTKGELE